VHPNGEVRVDVHVGPADVRAALARDVRVGLTAEQKWLPPIWFYDERGSELFDEITRLDEYYPTRTERLLLESHAEKIAAAVDADVLVELGSGTSDKTRLLIAAMREQSRLREFVPFDVSEETLRAAASAIARDWPGLSVHAIVGDFRHHLGHIPRRGRRLLAFLGGTIGNLTPPQRRRFLFDVDALLDDGDHFLLGVDLVKETDRLLAAYDDPRGVTAAFNRNVLHRLNRELRADFDPDAFEHVARWNEEESWIEMRLRARAAQLVTIAALDLTVEFAAGEDLLTEVSAKFTPEGLVDELWAAGLTVEQTWTDARGDILLALAAPYC
jgi:L-histidine N-alpha-methyltransferase